MKDKNLPICFFIIILLVQFIVVQPNVEAQSSYYVKVKNTKLRSAPQHFAPAVSDLKLGDALFGQEAKDGWYKVSTPSKKTGYVHVAVLSSQKIIPSGAKYNPKTDSSDVVLAGKGFNKEVEKDFLSKNPGINFIEVNNMDQMKVSDSEVISFAKSGGLKTNG